MASVVESLSYFRCVALFSSQMWTGSLFSGSFLKLKLTQLSFRLHINSQSSKFLTRFSSIVWFSKEVVVWEQHFASLLGKIHNSNDDNNNDNNMFSPLINSKVKLLKTLENPSVKKSLAPKWTKTLMRKTDVWQRVEWLLSPKI